MNTKMCADCQKHSGGNNRVYVMALLNAKREIDHAKVEHLFIWLYKKTQECKLRFALEIAAHEEGMTQDEQSALLVLKKLYTCCVDGKITPRINICTLYGDIAELVKGDVIKDGCELSL